MTLKADASVFPLLFTGQLDLERALAEDVVELSGSKKGVEGFARMLGQ